VVAKTSLLAVLICATLGGCSIQRFVINKAGDAISGESTVVARDDDPEFIRAAAPFSLKLTETLLEKSPDHEGMLLSAASNFTQYSYAFIQMDADELEAQDFERALQLHQRARRMYLRARDYGMRGLAVRHAGIDAALRSDPAAALAGTTRADLPLLYWTAAAWAAAIGQAKDDPQLIGDLPIVDELVQRAATLDADYGHGGLATLQISYEMARQARPAVARAHFARANAASGGRLAGPYVALAESVCVSQRARAEFLALLEAALAINADAYPEQRLENLILQRRARWLKSRVDELFLPEADNANRESAP
jgi:predicted anti-sigma-YlaC factor YlaD